MTKKIEKSSVLDHPYIPKFVPVEQYYHFSDSNKEILEVVEFVNNAPELAWACIHLALMRLHNYPSIFTPKDWSVLSAQPDQHPQWNVQGLRILQVLADKQTLDPKYKLNLPKYRKE